MTEEGFWLLFFQSFGLRTFESSDHPPKCVHILISGKGVRKAKELLLKMISTGSQFSDFEEEKLPCPSATTRAQCRGKFFFALLV